MAYAAVNVKVGTSLGEGRYSSAVVGRAVPTTNAAATTADTALATVVGADQTAVEAAVAVLEADGASPTQAHVNSLRTVWNTMKTDGATAKTATAAAVVATPTITSDVTVVWDASVVTGLNALKAAIQQALQGVMGSGALTP